MAGELNPHDASREEFRKYTLTDQEIQESFRLEDQRWSRDNQIKDWLKLGVMILLTFAWTLIVYFLEPGLR